MTGYELSEDGAAGSAPVVNPSVATIWLADAGTRIAGRAASTAKTVIIGTRRRNASPYCQALVRSSTRGRVTRVRGTQPTSPLGQKVSPCLGLRGSDDERARAVDAA